MCLRRFPVGRDSLEVKKSIKVEFLWIIAVTAGRFYECVSVFLEKRWQSVWKYNLDKELNGIKYFLRKKKFFFYWIRHRYQSKTCVEHIEQVIDKSLINSTNSPMNLPYFLHTRVICFKYCKKFMRSQIKKILFFGRIYGYVRFNFDIGNGF